MSFMTAERVFLDTNVLVYSYDASEPRKHGIARAVLESAVETGNAAISGQVLGEFVNVVTHRIAQPRTLAQAILMVGDLDALNVVAVDRSLVKQALLIQQAEQTSYWDALILAAATRARCTVLLSEDFGHGRRYGSVEARNPFIGGE